jgi:acetyl esterase/lipase
VGFVPSPQAQELLEELRAGVAERVERPEQARELYERAMAGFPAAEGTELTETRVGDVPALRVTAPGAEERVGILYLHGGGFAVGSARSNQDLIARLGHAAGVSVVGIDYGLLPEHPFPEALEQTLAAYGELSRDRPPGSDDPGRATERLVSDSGSARKLVLAGSSAGAGLALAAALRLRDEGRPLPTGLLLMSPWVDLTVSAPSLAEDADGDWFGREALVLAAETYLDGRDPTDPLASPLHADLSDLPPMLIQVGGSELLLDDAARLADAARQAGTDADLDVWPGMFHNFQLFPTRLSEAVAALERAGKWARERLPAAGANAFS